MLLMDELDWVLGKGTWLYIEPLGVEQLDDVASLLFRLHNQRLPLFLIKLVSHLNYFSKCATVAILFLLLEL